MFLKVRWLMKMTWEDDDDYFLLVMLAEGENENEASLSDDAIGDE